MKLRYASASPYVRKVIVLAIETGLDGRIERVPTDVRDPSTDLPGDNPLGKVPTLITDGGEALYARNSQVSEQFDAAWLWLRYKNQWLISLGRRLGCGARRVDRIGSLFAPFLTAA